MDLFLLLTFGAAALSGYYLLSCAFHPFTNCSVCSRSGESRSTTFKGAFGACRRCAGSGRRLRAGARLLGRKK